MQPIFIYLSCICNTTCKSRANCICNNSLRGDQRYLYYLLVINSNQFILVESNDQTEGLTEMAIIYYQSRNGSFWVYVAYDNLETDYSFDRCLWFVPGTVDHLLD